MILFVKKIWSILFAIVLYILIVLLCISSFTTNQEHWFVNVLSSKIFIFNIIPLFLIIEFLIDDTISKPSILRCNNRKKAMCLQVIQQYAFALIYLSIWFIMISIFTIVKFNVIDKVELLSFIHIFSKFLLEFILIINISFIIKRMNLKMLSQLCYIFTYILLIFDTTFIVQISKALKRFTGTDIGLVFSWILIDTNFATIFMILLVFFSSYIAFFHSSKTDIF